MQFVHYYSIQIYIFYRFSVRDKLLSLVNQS